MESDPERSSAPTIAVIGSFRKFLDEVTEASSIFRDAGVVVTSPKDGTVLDAEVEFVRFPSDQTDHDDATVQSIAMHRILSADAVYVVAVGGYIGKTTCYEIGRIVQLDRPLYFDTRPLDLPIHVPAGAVVAPSEFAQIVTDGTLKRWSEWADGPNHGLERDLLLDRPDPLL